MKYMLLIYADEKVIADEAARQHCYAESTELRTSCIRAGSLLRPTRCNR